MLTKKRTDLFAPPTEAEFDTVAAIAGPLSAIVETASTGRFGVKLDARQTIIQLIGVMHGFMTIAGATPEDVAEMLRASEEVVSKQTEEGVTDMLEKSTEAKSW